MGCYSGIGVIILLYFVVFVLNIVKTPKQMNCFGVLQRFQSGWSFSAFQAAFA